MRLAPFVATALIDSSIVEQRCSLMGVPKLDRCVWVKFSLECALTERLDLHVAG
jgi:hypothetical protein